MRAPFRIAIVNATPFVKEKDRNLLGPAEWKSLMQWVSFLHPVTLLKPEATGKVACDGWMPVPREVNVVPLYQCGASLRRRRASVAGVARAVLTPEHILYARMPNREGCWCDQVARSRGVPLLVELHGDWESAILHEDAQSLARKISRRYRATSAKTRVERMCRRAFCAVSIGPALAQKYLRRTTPTLITTNHLLERARYCERTDFTLHEPPRILFVGVLQKRKGLDVLFHALGSLKGSGRDFKMIIVGGGPERARLVAYAEKHQFAEDVEFLGHVPHGDSLFDQFGQADLFVLPSVAAEGVPRVTHEAMAVGCPVIATDIGSIAWQLREGAGIVVPPGEAQVLADAIVRVLDDAELRKQLSRKGYKRSLAHTLERQQQGIEEFVKRQISLLTS